MSGRGHRGNPRTSATEALPERNVEHTPRSEDASMNQPPAKPSRAADPRSGTLTMDQVIKIVTAAICQAREPSEEQRGMIERALKLRAKTYEGTSQSSRKKGKKWIDGRGT